MQMTRIFALLLMVTALAGDPADGVREAAQGWGQGAIKQQGAEGFLLRLS